MKRALIFLGVLWLAIGATAQVMKGIDLTKATLVYHEGDTPLARQMAELLADDIERVSGVRPQISTQRKSGENVVIGSGIIHPSRSHHSWRCRQRGTDRLLPPCRQALQGCPTESHSQGWSWFQSTGLPKVAGVDPAIPNR